MWSLWVRFGENLVRVTGARLGHVGGGAGEIRAGSLTASREFRGCGGVLRSRTGRVLGF